MAWAVRPGGRRPGRRRRRRGARQRRAELRHLPRCCSSPPPTPTARSMPVPSAGRASPRLGAVGAEWRNWAGDQACSPVELVRPADRDELAAAVAAAAAAGQEGERGRLGPLLHRGGDDRRARCSTSAALSGVIDADPLLRAWSRSGPGRSSPTSTRSCTGSAWRWRTSATSTARRSPARSRPAPTAPAPTCATSPPRSRRWSWSWPTAPSASCGADEPDLLRAARVGVGALGAISSVTLRCVPAFTLARVDTPLPREEVLDSFAERAEAHDHFELFTFPYADSALVLERNRTEAPPRPRAQRGRLPQRRRARELGARGPLGDGQAPPGDDPGTLAARRPARLGQQGHRPQRPDLRQRAPRPLHRDGVRGAARARARGRAGG